ncbi:hypothetical protein SASPL_134381 [Salvia splendens]|uniref:Uncharacterized protein n=1 Tax=Salvia splendens TaxID=180675 RepID=A0A8X8X7I7_SALSN|nr:hypothetical protein SASPL_134381 [Salvia splendens]
MESYEDEKVDLIFKVPNTKNEIWIDNMSLKSFTKAEWREQQERSINKYRKRDIKIKVTDKAGKPLEGANITLTHTRPLFLIGCGTGYSILEAKPYQDFFTARLCSVPCINAKDELSLPFGCTRMCLIDDNFKITSTGELVDRLILKEWRSNVVAVTGKDGVFSGRLFHGDYNLTCSHPSVPKHVEKTFKLEKEEGALQFGITLK